jgi:DNA processing protein
MNINLSDIDRTWMKENGATIITENDLPLCFQTIPNPPSRLFCLGNFNLLNEQCIAVAGSRKASETGLKLTIEATEIITKSGIIVVSGLALGVDTVAHQSSLDFGGKTIAILPRGFAEIYPKRNIKLASKILESGGLLLSEYAPYHKLHNKNFIQRNRLQSAVSKAVIITECEKKGGTMHTARFAREQHKPILCFRKPLQNELSDKASGNQYLIKNDLARPIDSTAELNKWIEGVLSSSNS